MTHEINTDAQGESDFEDQCDKALDRVFNGEDTVGFTFFFQDKVIPVGKFALGFRTLRGEYAYVFSSIKEVNLEVNSVSLFREGVFVADNHDLVNKPLPEFMQDCPVWLTDLGQGF